MILWVSWVASPVCVDWARAGWSRTASIWVTGHWLVGWSGIDYLCFICLLLPSQLAQAFLHSSFRIPKSSKNRQTPSYKHLFVPTATGQRKSRGQAQRQCGRQLPKAWIFRETEFVDTFVNQSTTGAKCNTVPKLTELGKGNAGTQTQAS